jgi:hypothetical protein
MVDGRDFIIITHHFPVPMKKQDPWPFVMPHVETAKDGSTLPDLYGEVKAILGARAEILAGIKNESQYRGVIDQRIISHQFKFSIKRKNREGGVLL